MTTTVRNHDSQLPELREFVKENALPLHTFCHYLLQEEHTVEDVLLDVFRRFGDTYRKHSGKRDSGWEALEMRIRLYRLAWEKIRDETATLTFQWNLGRDTRVLKRWDENLLVKDLTLDPTAFDALVLERLRRVDIELRAPVVLKDILRFEDEEVVRVLSLRWGVYRHRLHRGRLEFRDALRGSASSAEAKTTSPFRETTW